VTPGPLIEKFEYPWRWSEVEPMTAIEPAYSAWEAISSAERLFYTGRGSSQHDLWPHLGVTLGNRNLR